MKQWIRTWSMNVALGSITRKTRDVSKILGSARAGKMSYKALSKRRIHCKTCPCGQEVL